MSFAFNVGRSIGSAAASVVHGTRIGSSQLVAGTKQGYAERAEELKARRAALGLSNVAPAEVIPTPAPARRRAAAR